MEFVSVVFINPSKPLDFFHSSKFCRVVCMYVSMMYKFIEEYKSRSERTKTTTHSPTFSFRFGSSSFWSRGCHALPCSIPMGKNTRFNLESHDLICLYPKLMMANSSNFMNQYRLPCGWVSLYRHATVSVLPGIPSSRNAPHPVSRYEKTKLPFGFRDTVLTVEFSAAGAVIYGKGGVKSGSNGGNSRRMHSHHETEEKEVERMWEDWGSSIKA